MGGKSDPVKDPLNYIAPIVNIPTDYGKKGLKKGIEEIVPKPPEIPPPASLPDMSAPPTPTEPTNAPDQAAKRRLAALRMGLLSTITTSPWGTPPPTNLLVPQAFANGLKTTLGQ